MNCRECVDHLYDYLDRELTPEVAAEIRAHLEACPPCGDYFDFESLFLRFLRVRCQAQSAPPALRRKILEQLLEAE